MAGIPEQGGSYGVWGTMLRDFFVQYWDLVSGLWKTKVIPGTALEDGAVNTQQLADAAVTSIKVNSIAWEKIEKSGAQLSDLASRSHYELTNIGVNTHDQIDAYFNEILAGTAIYAADSGSVNHLVATFAPAIAAHTTGLALRIRAANTNTGSVDFAPNGLTAKTVKRRDGGTLIANDVLSGLTYVLIYNGTDYIIQNPEVQSGQSVLSVDFDITADTTWQDTGLSITLPTNGTYLVMGTIRGAAQASTANLSVISKLYNSTDAADVANSERLLLVTQVSTASMQGNAPYQVLITVAATKTIKVYAQRAAGTWTACKISSNTFGRSMLSWLKIA